MCGLKTNQRANNNVITSQGKKLNIASISEGSCILLSSPTPEMTACLPAWCDQHFSSVPPSFCLCRVSQSCPTLRNPMNRSPPGSSAHGILQARILEWIAIPFSKLLFTLQIYYPSFTLLYIPRERNSCIALTGPPVLWFSAKCDRGKVLKENQNMREKNREFLCQSLQDSVQQQLCLFFEAPPRRSPSFCGPHATMVPASIRGPQ